MLNSGLPFQLTDPRNASTLVEFQLTLLHRTTRASVKMTELSSGECVILSTIFWLFASHNGRLPKVVILDEPDAHLHPSMVRRFLDFLQKALVERHNVRVILTTHSPTTVALSPEEAIFLMRPSTSARRISKSSRDEAIGLLTEGVPSLRIRYENRRQVFVESQYDADNYQALFELVRSDLTPECSLQFIASGKLKSQNSGSCDHVKFFVDELVKNGIETVSGIVDWDGKTSSVPPVFVLGNAERYALENFLLDPLAVGALLLRERMKKPEDLGLPGDATHWSIVQLSEGSLQDLVNRILMAIQAKLKPLETSRAEPKKVHTRSELSYELPAWFREMNGHRLEEKLVEAFPGLSKWQSKGPNALKREALIDLVFRDIPQLVPQPIVETFRAIQAYGRP
jgi:energy-coupling factor transporter ATP-binding protein EcfA2